jgi:hypothetical protein
MADHLIIDTSHQPPQIRCLHCGADWHFLLDCPSLLLMMSQIGYNPTAGTPAFTPNQQMDVDIPNRDEQHGGMEAVGTLSQGFKEEMRLSKNWTELTAGEREALDVIVHKIGRVLSGRNPHDPEHWRDIAGYAVAARRADSHAALNTP